MAQKRDSSQTHETIFRLKYNTLVIKYLYKIKCKRFRRWNASRAAFMPTTPCCVMLSCVAHSIPLDIRWENMVARVSMICGRGHKFVTESIVGSDLSFSPWHRIIFSIWFFSLSLSLRTSNLAESNEHYSSKFVTSEEIRDRENPILPNRK